MKKIVDYNKCVGCQACGDVCPVSAISFEVEKGFWYPIINESKCLDCKKCIDVCPSCVQAVNEEYDYYNTEAYAAWNLNEEQRDKSASGGIFASIASYYLERGWYVSGCIYSEDFKSCNHIVTNDINKLDKMIGSKYFQSNMHGVYIEIKKLLNDGQHVMFCGTPCQTAALYRYLKGVSLENLLIIDLLCKGVPSPYVHEKYISFLEKKERSNVVAFRSKSKKNGWGKTRTEIKYEKGKNSIIKSPLEPLFVVNGLSVRPACEKCIYKGYDRVSDISIGDFWGVENISDSIKKKGVSALIVYTQKGASLLSSMNNKLSLNKRSVFEVSNCHNPGFSHQIHIDERQEQFFYDLENREFKQVINKYVKSNNKLYIIVRKLKWMLSKLKYISIPKFIYYNFFSNHVIRSKGAFIIPGHNTIFTFGKGSVLKLDRGIALINTRKPRGSKAEAWIQLDTNSRFVIHDGLDMRNCRIGIQENALLEIGDLEMNGLCNIMVKKSVRIGNRVMIARNVTIYDSDYHPFSIGDNIQHVSTKSIEIGNDVWIGNGATIMKGVHIGDGAVIGAKAFVVKRVKTKTMVSGNPAKEICENVYWSKGH